MPSMTCNDKWLNKGRFADKVYIMIQLHPIIDMCKKRPYLLLFAPQMSRVVLSTHLATALLPGFSSVSLAIQGDRSEEVRPTLRRSEFFRLDSCMRFASSVCKNWEDISNMRAASTHGRRQYS